jgi:hypothetical protein
MRRGGVRDGHGCSRVTLRPTKPGNGDGQTGATASTGAGVGGRVVRTGMRRAIHAWTVVLHHRGIDVWGGDWVTSVCSCCRQGMQGSLSLSPIRSRRMAHHKCYVPDILGNLIDVSSHILLTQINFTHVLIRFILQALEDVGDLFFGPTDQRICFFLIHGNPATSCV